MVRLSGPEKHALDEFCARVRTRFGPRVRSLALFGSRARGEAGPTSDLDLLVIVRGLARSRLERQRVFWQLAREVSEEFADILMPVLLTPDEAHHVKPFYLGMLSGHEVLLDVDGYFAAVLDRLRARLAELGARRCVDPDGYEYWDLKPDWRPGDVVSL